MEGKPMITVAAVTILAGVLEGATTAKRTRSKLLRMILGWELTETTSLPGLANNKKGGKNKCWLMVTK